MLDNVILVEVGSFRFSALLREREKGRVIDNYRSFHHVRPIVTTIACK